MTQDSTIPTHIATLLVRDATIPSQDAYIPTQDAGLLCRLSRVVVRDASIATFLLI